MASGGGEKDKKDGIPHRPIGELRSGETAHARKRGRKSLKISGKVEEITCSKCGQPTAANISRCINCGADPKKQMEGTVEPKGITRKPHTLLDSDSWE